MPIVKELFPEMGPETVTIAELPATLKVVLVLRSTEPVKFSTPELAPMPPIVTMPERTNELESVWDAVSADQREVPSTMVTVPTPKALFLETWTSPPWRRVPPE